MLFSPVFAKRQHRPTPPTTLPFSFFSVLAPHSQHSNFQPATDVITVFDYHPFYHTLTDLPSQRRQRKPFEINPFRIVFLATEGIPLSSHSGTHPRLCIHLSFQSLAGTHFATSFFSNSCRNGGVYPPRRHFRQGWHSRFKFFVCNTYEPPRKCCKQKT